ncbi:MAG: RNA polymerase subunit sigma-70, partial [Planctomycetia bacterium]|nr:RNA polymerase subunit sigma-70 [Planctomycetia bacterium]
MTWSAAPKKLRNYVDGANLDESDNDAEITAEETGTKAKASADSDASDNDNDDTLTEQIENWSDDPVRMYLTQMGEIPLLTRAQEIYLARQIETTRAQFR